MATKKTVGELVYKIRGDSTGFGATIKNAEAQVKKLGQTMSNAGKSFSNIKNQILSVKTAVQGFIAGVAVRGLFGLAQAGAQLDSLTQSFTRLSSEMGINGKEALDTLREFSAGTISNTDLIQSANRAMVLGVAKSTEEFGTLMQVARIRAADMGLSTTQAFNDIVTGIGRSSPLILDNLGIVVKQNEAYDRYAASLNKTTAALTDNEKREALKFAVLEDARNQIERVGEVTVSYSERLQQATTFVQNLRDGIGRALLPAFASLLSATNVQNQGFLQTTEQINTLGKKFYQFAQGLIVATRVAKNFYGVMKLIAQGIVASVTVVLESVLKVADTIGEAFGVSSDGLKNAIKDVEGFKNAVLDQSQETLDGMLDNTEKLRDSLDEAFDPKNYQGLSDGQMASLIAGGTGSDSVAGSLEEAAKAAEEAKKKLEDFQKQMLGTIDSSRQAQKALGEELTKTFTDFGEGLASNASETAQGLAGIFISAEDRLKELKEERRKTDDRDRRKQIKEEIKAQEEVLAERKKFEEREAERVTALRTRLEEAGIDAAKAGVDGLLEVRDLEAEIQEQRRVADLNEFARFEEQQIQKREALVTAFIEEVKLLNDKIDKQKALEVDVTTFVLSQNELREESVRQFADTAIAKYGEMAASLRNAISLQQRLNSLRSNPRQFHDGGYVDSRGGEVHAGEYVVPASLTRKYSGLISRLESERQSGVVNNNRTVNAPVNQTNIIQDGVDIRVIGRELAFELGKL